MALFAVLLGACGLGLAGLGVEMSLENELRAGLLSLVFGLLTLYGAYLFVRASRRTRSEIRGMSVAEVNVRRRKVRTGITLALVSATDMEMLRVKWQGASPSL